MQILSQLLSSTLGLPANSYIYTLVPTSRGLAAISSDDSLRIFDPSSPSSQPFTWSNVNASVTCLKHFNDNVVATAGRDGFVRFWDVRERSLRSTVTFAAGFPISATACSENLKYVTAGAELESNGPGEAPILLWDIRNPKATILKLMESHTDTITELQIRDAGIPVLLSASTDGLINVFDLEASQVAEDEEPLDIVNHASAVHHAGFLPYSSFQYGFGRTGGEYIYGLSTDETFSIYPMDRPGLKEEEEGSQVEQPKLFGDVRGLLGCEYVIDVKAEMPLDVRDPIMAVGKHSEQLVDIIPFCRTGSGDWTFSASATVRLPGAHGEEIVRSVHIDHKSGTIFTCGEDGFVRAWRGLSTTTPEDAEMEDQAVSKAAKREAKRKKGDDKAKEARFKPY